MSTESNVPAIATTPKTNLSIAGLTVEISSEVAAIVRTMVSDSTGAIRVSFVPATAKDGKTSLKSLGYKGQSAKAVLRKAKREIGGAFIGAMANAVTTGKMGWRSATLSKTGTVGVFFDQGDSEDVAALTAAEEKTKALEKELAALKAKLSESEKAALQAELAAA